MSRSQKERAGVKAAAGTLAGQPLRVVLAMVSRVEAMSVPTPLIATKAGAAAGHELVEVAVQADVRLVWPE